MADAFVARGRFDEHFDQIERLSGKLGAPAVTCVNETAQRAILFRNENDAERRIFENALVNLECVSRRGAGIPLLEELSGKLAESFQI